MLLSLDTVGRAGIAFLAEYPEGKHLPAAVALPMELPERRMEEEVLAHALAQDNPPALEDQVLTAL